MSTIDIDLVKYALYLTGWSYEHGDGEILKSKGAKILAPEYEQVMDGSLFCPICHTNLIRKPKNKLLFTNNRKASFSHLPRYKSVACAWRTQQADGKRYLSEESAKKALEDEELVLIHGFLSASPSPGNDEVDVYDQSQVEDINGPITPFPLSRHNGEHFHLPTKLSTIRGVTRRFDLNLSRYYVLPGQKYPMQLLHLLHDVRLVTAPNPIPQLYYGVITHSDHLGKKQPNNIRMTYLKCHKTIKDFCIKETDEKQKPKGINDTSAGRVILVWGTILDNGIGLCFTGLGWGEFALLPEKYNDLIL